MSYSPILVQPFRDELTAIGFQELRTAADVDQFMSQKTGTALLVINSVCGCAAAMARPGVRLALERAPKPDRLATTLAGQDIAATAKARSYLSQYPPSSPSIAFFKDGQLAHFIPRQLIEGRDAESIARDLERAFNLHCAPAAADAGVRR